MKVPKKFFLKQWHQCLKWKNKSSSAQFKTRSMQHVRSAGPFQALDAIEEPFWILIIQRIFIHYKEPVVQWKASMDAKGS